MASTHRHATSWTGDPVGHGRRRSRRPIDPTNVRLVGLGVYLTVVVLMVLFADPASASDGLTSTSTLSALPSVLFLVVVGGGLVVRSIRRRGHLPERRPGARAPQRGTSHTA